MKTKQTLGIPQLNYHGLDQVWLAKELGQRHWNLLSSGPALTNNNERLYASFFCVEIDFGDGQNRFCEFDQMDIDSHLFKFNSQIYKSIHTFSNQQTTGTAVLESIFVKKANNSNRLLKDNPTRNIRDVVTTDTVSIDNHKKIKQQVKSIRNFDDFIELQFNPEVYFNCVKILYCANYLNLVAQSEFLHFPTEKSPIKNIKTYYFGNINFGDQVKALTKQHENTYTTILVSNGNVIAKCVIQR